MDRPTDKTPLDTDPVNLISQLMNYMSIDDILLMSESTASISATIQKANAKWLRHIGDIYWINRLQHRYSKYAYVAININPRLLVELLDINAMDDPVSLLNFFSSVADHYSDNELLELIDFVSHELEWSRGVLPILDLSNTKIYVSTHLEETRPDIFAELVDKCLWDTITLRIYKNTSYEMLLRNFNVIKILIERSNPRRGLQSLYNRYSSEILQQAVEHNDIFMAEQLLEPLIANDNLKEYIRSYNLAIANDKLIKLIEVASAKGYGNMLILLLIEGDVKNIDYNNYYQAFSLAIQYHHVNIVRIFANKVGDQSTILPKAIDLAIVGKWLGYGFDMANGEAISKPFAICHIGIPEIVSLILGMETEPHTIDYSKLISYALQYANKQVLIALIQHPSMTQYIPFIQFAGDIGAINDTDIINVYLNILFKLVSPGQFQNTFEELILGITNKKLAQQYYNSYLDDYGPNEQLFNQIILLN
jgi:hypothetical protein